VRNAFAVPVLVVLLSGACGDDGAGDEGAGDPGDVSGETTEAPRAASGATAVWRVDDASPPDEAATSFTALVTRLGCNGGETGTVLEPVVDVDGERIEVTFTVEPLPPGDHTCPGNDEVPVVVELAEPVGGRELVDGACLSGEAATTSFCTEQNPVRWPPQP
jgi:hypothetical protein